MSFLHRVLCLFSTTNCIRWMEVGNSGVFRPEMLLPMGLPEDVTVIAWGLSLERCVTFSAQRHTAITHVSFVGFTSSLTRPTMIRYKINNIRELFGHKALLCV
eukprot:Selendium_serpulae@DN5718_c0_g1_i2.p1